MKKKFCLLTLAFFVGCIPKVKIPQDVMPKEEMISFLIDIHILEGQTGQLRISRDSAQILFKYFEKELLDKHQVTDSMYYKSLEFYYSNPVIMEEIYAAVLDSLSLYERMSKGIPEAEQSEQPIH